MAGPRRVDRTLVALLTGVALSVRLALLEAPPYGDEAAHFAMAKTLGFLDGSVHWIDLGIPFQLYPLTIGRPMFTLLHAPGALFGFTGFRALGMLYSAMLAGLGFVLVRKMGAGQPAAVLAGLVIALHPTFVVWGGRIFPDSAMAMLVLTGLLAYLSRRPRLASVLLLLACLTKETAIPATAAVAVHAVVGGIRERAAAGKTGWAALQPSGAETWLVCATVLSPIGMVVSYLVVPKIPGWTTGGSVGVALEQLLLWSWLAIPALVVALRPQARPVVAALFMSLAFYAVFILGRDGNVNGWYAILPAALAICLTVTAIDAGLRSARWPRLAAGLAGVAFCFASLLAVVGADGFESTLHPLDARGEPGLPESIQFVRGEDPWLAAAIAFQHREGPKVVVSLDVAWFWIAWPFTGTSATVFSNTVGHPPEQIPVDELVRHAEASDLTWLQDWNSTFHQAFRATYADCKVFEANFLSAYRLGDCPGRADLVTERMQADPGQTA